jgi:hypothetical protein
MRKDADDRRKEEIALTSAEWLDMKLPPWVGPERREMWRGIIYDLVLAALHAFEGLQETGPRAIRTFCAGCTAPLRVKEEHAGGLVQCPACGRVQRLRFGRN